MDANDKALRAFMLKCRIAFQRNDTSPFDVLSSFEGSCEQSVFPPFTNTNKPNHQPSPQQPSTAAPSNAIQSATTQPGRTSSTKEASSCILVQRSRTEPSLFSTPALTALAGSRQKLESTLARVAAELFLALDDHPPRSQRPTSETNHDDGQLNVVETAMAQPDPFGDVRSVDGDASKEESTAHSADPQKLELATQSGVHEAARPPLINIGRCSGDDDLDCPEDFGFVSHSGHQSPHLASVTMQSLLHKISTPLGAGDEGKDLLGSTDPSMNQSATSFVATREAKESLIGEKLVLNDRYVFLAKIGRGSQGTVWRAEDLQEGGEVAIKVVPRDNAGISGRAPKVLMYDAVDETSRSDGHPEGEPSGADDGSQLRHALSMSLLRNTAAHRNLVKFSPATDEKVAENVFNLSLSEFTISKVPHNSSISEVALASGENQKLRHQHAVAPEDVPRVSSLRNEANPVAPLRKATFSLRLGASPLNWAEDTAESSVRRENLLTSLLGDDDDNEAEAAAANASGKATRDVAEGAFLLRKFYDSKDSSPLALNVALEILLGLSSHDHVLPLKEIIDDEKLSALFLVMPLAIGPPVKVLPGGSIKPGPLRPSVVLRHIMNIASALEYLHAANIVHCDIKLDNLLLMEGKCSGRDSNRSSQPHNEKRLVLADFGICQIGQSIQIIGGGRGTPAYWAPECFNDEFSTFTAQTDCYALGVCAYAMTFGNFPYWTAATENPVAWGEAIKTKISFPSVEEMKSWPGYQCWKDSDKDAFYTLKEIIQGLLRDDPARRFSANNVCTTTI